MLNRSESATSTTAWSLPFGLRVTYSPAPSAAVDTVMEKTAQAMASRRTIVAVSIHTSVNVESGTGDRRGTGKDKKINVGTKGAAGTVMPWDAFKNMSDVDATPEARGSFPGFP
jgi:hypothetical protein